MPPGHANLVNWDWAKTINAAPLATGKWPGITRYQLHVGVIKGSRQVCIKPSIPCTQRRLKDPEIICSLFCATYEKDDRTVKVSIFAWSLRPLGIWKSSTR